MRLKANLLYPQEPVATTARWTDIIVGAQGDIEFKDRWRFGAWADIGGFGLGSDFSWWSEIDAGYRFKPWFHMRLGWTFMYVSYSGTVQDHDVRWDMWLTGPHIGVSFSF